jgi:hypothetical protein
MLETPRKLLNHPNTQVPDQFNLPLGPGLGVGVFKISLVNLKFILGLTANTLANGEPVTHENIA